MMLLAALEHSFWSCVILNAYSRNWHPNSDRTTLRVVRSAAARPVRSPDFYMLGEGGLADEQLICSLYKTARLSKNHKFPYVISFHSIRSKN
jgi:hypothetical protein